jgi:hypothetical protein
MTQHVGKTARKGANALVSNLIANVDYLFLRVCQQTFSRLEPQSIEKLQGRHAGDLAEGAIEMPGTGKPDSRQFLKRHRLVKLVLHDRYHALH